MAHRKFLKWKYQPSDEKLIALLASIDCANSLNLSTMVLVHPCMEIGKPKLKSIKLLSQVSSRRDDTKVNQESYPYQTWTFCM